MNAIHQANTQNWAYEDQYKFILDKGTEVTFIRRPYDVRTYKPTNIPGWLKLCANSVWSST